MPRGQEPPCTVFAIHDDTYVAVPLEQAKAVVRIVDETFKEDGLQLNHNKCKLVSKEWLQDAAYTLVQDGLVMLGTSVGFGDYEQRKSVEITTSFAYNQPPLCDSATGPLRQPARPVPVPHLRVGRSSIHLPLPL